MSRDIVELRDDSRDQLPWMRIILLCEMHCYLWPHIFWVNYFRLSHGVTANLLIDSKGFLLDNYCKMFAIILRSLVKYHKSSRLRLHAFRCWDPNEIHWGTIHILRLQKYWMGRSRKRPVWLMFNTVHCVQIQGWNIKIILYS